MNHDAGILSQADAIFATARKLAPNDSNITAMTGFLRHYQGRFDEELKLYEDAMKGNPDDFGFLNNMAWTLAENKKQPDEALKKINDAISRSPVPLPQCFDTRGVIYTKLGQYDDAIKDLESAVRDRPTGLVWAHLARAYYKAKRMDDFQHARDEAKKAGLTPNLIEDSERASSNR